MSDTGSASPVKQAPTDSGTTTPAPAAPKFSEREEAVLKLAWQCLKSGPPDIDLAKLTEVGEFKTQKTASNTWGTIKKKLGLVNAGNASAASATAAAAGDGPTPKAKATPKKRTKKTTDDNDDDETASPVKKPRATPKKAAVKAKAEEAGEEGEGDE